MPVIYFINIFRFVLTGLLWVYLLPDAGLFVSMVEDWNTNADHLFD